MCIQIQCHTLHTAIKQLTSYLTEVTNNKQNYTTYNHIILNYIKQTLQFLSNCFGVNEDLKLAKELKSVSFGNSWFHIDRTWYG